MPDREKVIRHIKAEIEIAKLCKKDFASVDIDMLSDAYELLKEQEAVKIEPHYVDVNGKHFICGVECGYCGFEIGATDRFCRWCGRAVKWE